MEENRNPDPRGTENPQQNHPRRSTPRQKVIRMAKSTEKDRIFKAAKEKEIITYKGKRIAYQQIFQQNFAGKKGVQYYIQCAEWKIIATKNTTSS